MPDQDASFKRRFPRYHTAVDVTIYQGRTIVNGRITQISRGGCLIFPPLPPLSDQALRISFRLAGDLPYINCKGEVAYSFADKGTGVAFTEISLHNQDLITSHFEKQSPASGPTNP
jgi:hypothetical protein